MKVQIWIEDEDTLEGFVARKNKWYRVSHMLMYQHILDELAIMTIIC